MKTPYLIGIDLGTTNSCLTYISCTARGKQKSAIKLFSIPQLVKPGEIENRHYLPSFFYIPGAYDLPEGSFAVPWDKNRKFIIGELAHDQGRKVPGRLIHSAKSWLCHRGVDRYGEILPWGGSTEIKKHSPVEITAHYLRYLKETWNHFQAKTEEEYLEKQSIVLTVPAAFDEVARELTMEAAAKAGLGNVVLLEEPMAAFYYWIYSCRAKWPDKVRDGMIALVCDVGGGTTDFSLIEIKREDDTFQFKRAAVGNHLLLGGDNIDLALALNLEAQRKKKLDPVQFIQLVGYCRCGKELLWQDDSKIEYKFTIAGRSSSVIGGTLSFALTRSLLDQIALEGFFPQICFEQKKRKPKTGFREWGLPYESEPAITRHLLDFLKNHLSKDQRPDLILFNGGALTPSLVRKRLQKQLSTWFGQNDRWKPAILTNRKLNQAVAFGAAYFNRTRHGEGIRISGGSSRSCYLVIQGKSKQQALCLLPFGTREGEQHIIERKLQVLAGSPVSFSLYSSTTRKEDQPGDITDITGELIALAPIQTILKTGKKTKKKEIPVQLQVELTEIGTLDLWLRALNSERKWRLQFQIRSVKKEIMRQEKLPVAELQKAIHDTFHLAKDPHKLPGILQKILGQKKESWSIAANRKIFDILTGFIHEKHSSPEHEARWFNLAGFCLRPGSGCSGDQVRIKKLWGLFFEKVHHEKNIQAWVEWWIMWRRVAAGLNGHQQMELFRLIANHLLPKTSSWYNKKSPRKHVKVLELAEMWRTSSSFEYLPVDLRYELGQSLIGKATLDQHEYWALGRLAARDLFYGNAVIMPERISHWLDHLLSFPKINTVGLYSIAQIAKRTGDRAMDIDDKQRKKVLERLEQYPETPKLSQIYSMVEEVTELNTSLHKHYLGDSFPPGLILSEKQ